MNTFTAWASRTRARARRTDRPAASPRADARGRRPRRPSLRVPRSRAFLPHRHDAAHRARDGALHVQEVTLGVHLVHGQPDLRALPGTHVARHPLALDHARRIGARSDRARLPVPRVAVRVRPAVERVAVDDTLEAPALADAGDLHLLAFLELLHGHDAARLRRLAREGELAQHPRRRAQARFRGVTLLRLGSALRL